MDVNDWVEYKCRTGQTLYIKVAVGNQWPTDDKPNASTSQFKRFCSIGIQTDDTNCDNGCTSMYINNHSLFTKSVLQSNKQKTSHVDKQHDFSPDSSSMSSKDTSTKTSFASELTEVLRVLDEDFDSPNIEGESRNDSSGEGIQRESKYSPDENADNVKHKVPETENIETANQLTDDSQPPSMVKERQDVLHSDNNEKQTKFEEKTSTELNENMQELTFTNQETSTEKFQCMNCNEIFNCKNAYSEHLLTHRRHTCHLCGKEYSYKFYLKYHLITHNQRSIMQTVSCNFCDKKFTDQDEHDTHIKGHVGEKPYVCTICDKQFKTRNNFKAHHQRVHTASKRYNCTYCDKTFQRSDHLHRHMRKHTGERPHKCIFCGKAFGRKDNLTCHLRTHMK